MNISYKMLFDFQSLHKSTKLKCYFMLHIIASIKTKKNNEISMTILNKSKKKEVIRRYRQKNDEYQEKYKNHMIKRDL